MIAKGVALQNAVWQLRADTLATRCFIDAAKCCDGSGLGSGSKIIGFKIQRTTIRVPTNRYVTPGCKYMPHDALNEFDPESFGYQHSCTVPYATTAALSTYSASGSGTLTGLTNERLTIDGTAQTTGNDLLVKNETSGNAKWNWLYTITDQGADDPGGRPWVLTRKSTADEDSEVESRLAVRVVNGTVNTRKVFVLSTADPIVLNTDALTVDEFATASNNPTTLLQTLAPGLYVSKAKLRLRAIEDTTDCENATGTNDQLATYSLGLRVNATYTSRLPALWPSFSAQVNIFYDDCNQIWWTWYVFGYYAGSSVFIESIGGLPFSWSLFDVRLTYSGGSWLLSGIGTDAVMTAAGFDGFTATFTGGTVTLVGSGIVWDVAGTIGSL